MKGKSTAILKLVVILLGVSGLLLVVFLFPWLNHLAKAIQPALLNWRYPIFIGVCLSLIPFAISLVKVFQLLNYIDRQQAFSRASVQALRIIKYCAITISIIYTGLMIILFMQSNLYPAVSVIGIPILFTSLVMSVFAAVLEGLFQSAFTIKSENDLTI